jgi:hypothetical protein
MGYIRYIQVVVKAAVIVRRCLSYYSYVKRNVLGLNVTEL